MRASRDPASDGRHGQNVRVRRNVSTGERPAALGEFLKVRKNVAAAIALLVFSSVSNALQGNLLPVGESLHPQALPCSSDPPAASRWVSLGLTAPQLPPGVSQPPQFDVRGIVLDPVLANRLWVATSYGLFRTENGGNSWQLVLVGADGIFGLAVSPTSGSILIASDSQSIFRSVDGGDNWATVQSAHLVKAITFDSTNSSAIYAGASYGYLGYGMTVPGWVYSSSDGGVIWTVPDPGFQPFTILDLLAIPASPQAVIAATQEGIFRSWNQGQSWTRSDAPGRFLATAVAFSPSAGGILVSTASNGYFDGTTSGTVLRSSDAGLHFEILFTGFGFTSIVVDPFAPANIYAAGFPGSCTVQTMESRGLL